MEDKKGKEGVQKQQCPPKIQTESKDVPFPHLSNKQRKNFVYGLKFKSLHDRPDWDELQGGK